MADVERSKGTICLAITPAMKALEVKNRCRIFEIPKTIEYVAAVPRMQRYIDVSTNIYASYLSFVSKDDIHVYSIDECYEQYSFFVNPEIMEKDRQITRSVNELKTKFGKNAILKGIDLLEGATTIE